MATQTGRQTDQSQLPGTCPSPNSINNVTRSSGDGHITTISVKMNSYTDSNQNNSLISHEEPPKYGTAVEKTTASNDISSQMKTEPSKASHEEGFWTTVRDHSVKLRMAKGEGGSETPLTVPGLLQQTVQRVPNQTALAVKRNGQWQKWTYRKYYDDVCRAAKSFIKLGLQPYYSVGILGFNSPEWFIANIGAIFAGGFATGIYATNTPEACEYIASNSKANVIVVENNQQLQKILKIKVNLPDLKAIVQYSGEVVERDPNVYSWADFMKLGDGVPDDNLMARLKGQTPNKCCTLIYTSGTTGNPKGVMLSHDNLTWNSLSSVKAVNLTFGSEVIVSYLPLSHVAAQMLDIYVSMSCGASIFFAQPDALRGTLAVTLREVRPTSFLGVPRVWEKMMEKMIEVGRGSSGMKRKIAAWAKGMGLRGSYNAMNGNGNPMCWGLANTLVFKKVRTALGFDRCKYFFSGAAPITKDTIDFFLSLNITIQDIYGMSESTGPHTFNRQGAGNRVTSVGFSVPGVHTKLANTDSDGTGEVCMYGRHIFMGYLDEDGKTRETFDDDGYLKTGDLGRIDKDGFLFITGRIKELIITAGGENIAPIPVEDAVKEVLPCISQCMLIGDKRKFLSMLLTLKTEINMDTLEPLDKLTKPAQEWCRSVGSNVTTVSEVIRNQDVSVLKAIQAGIDQANTRAVSRAAKVQKWSILPADFSIPGGELGPTMKLRRPIVSKLYSKTIDAFYTDT